MARVVIDKQAGERRQVPVDFAARLTAGDSLNGAVVTVTDSAGADVSGAMLVGTPTVGSDSVLLTVQGGGAGQVYLLTVHVTTVSGASLDELGTIVVRSAKTVKTPLTVDEIKTRYLHGIKLVDPNTGRAYSDQDIEKDLRAAEDWVEQNIHTFLRPTRIVCEPQAGALYDAEEPAYDYPPNFYDGERWGFLKLRRWHVQSVERMFFAYPNIDQTKYEVPASWVRLDKRYGMIRLVPDRVAIYAAFNAFMLSMFSGGRSVPQSIFLSYTAGFTPQELLDSHQELLQLVGKLAAANTLMVVSDALSQGVTSTSNSADGLSQSISSVASGSSLLYGPRIKQYLEDVQKGLDAWLEVERGPRMTVLGMTGFNEQGFETFLAQRGQRVAWRRSAPCPCRSNLTGGSDPRCALCKGEGYLWDAESVDTYTELLIRGAGDGERLGHPLVAAITSVQAGARTYLTPSEYVLFADMLLWKPQTGPAEGMQYTVVYNAVRDYRIGVSGVTFNKQFAQFGEWDRRDMIATVPARDASGALLEIYGIGDFDRVTLVDSVVRQSFVGQRGQYDTVPERTIRAVTDAFGLHNGAKMPLGEGTNFRVTGNTVEWLSSALAVGEGYTLRYVASPEYFVWTSIEQPRAHDLGKALPKRVVLRSFDLFGRDKR